MKHLTFQLFTAGPGFNTEAGNGHTMRKLPAAGAVEAQAQSVLDAIGAYTPAPDRRLGIMIGPLCLDYTDAQLRTIIDRAFTFAITHRVAVGFHIDDSKFWSRRSDLWRTAANVETSGWRVAANTGQYLNWGEEWKLAPQACFNAPAVMQEAYRVARVIGARIAAYQPDLFAGVIAGWETAIGPEYGTAKELGYRALMNRGFSAAKPPASMKDELEIVIRDWISIWATGLFDAGVAVNKIYAHITPDNAPIRSAFGSARFAPGFSAYPGTGVIEQIKAMAPTAWALSEGANVNIYNVPPTPGETSMLAYLDDLFGSGAALVNLFGWGVGEPGNVFRQAIESEAALADIWQWLTGG